MARIFWNVLAAAIPFIVPTPAKKKAGNLTSSIAKPISHTRVGYVKKAAKRTTLCIEAAPVEAIKASDIYIALWTMPRNDLQHTKVGRYTKVVTCAKITIETRSNEY
jgi:hypothetical protein